MLMDTKEATKIIKPIAEYTKITGGKTMEATIDFLGIKDKMY